MVRLTRTWKDAWGEPFLNATPRLKFGNSRDQVHHVENASETCHSWKFYFADDLINKSIIQL